MGGAILIVDDEALVVRGLKRELPRDFDVVCARSRVEAMNALRKEHRIRLALIDVRLGRDHHGGLEVLDELASKRPAIVRALMTGGNDRAVINRAAARDAHFLMKPFPREALDPLIARARMSSHGESAGAATTRLSRDVDAQAKLWRLSAQQLAVLAGRVAGKDNATIAKDLEITPKTLRNYAGHILAKAKRFKTLDALVIELLQRAIRKD